MERGKPGKVAIIRIIMVIVMAIIRIIMVIIMVIIMANIRIIMVIILAIIRIMRMVIIVESPLQSHPANPKQSHHRREEKRQNLSPKHCHVELFFFSASSLNLFSSVIVHLREKRLLVFSGIVSPSLSGR